MLISERIFERLQELGMNQKEFSQKTGILQSTVSEWKNKHTNPSADKIMIICSVLDVTPEWLLSGAEVKDGYRNKVEWYVVDRNTDVGLLVSSFNRLGQVRRARLLGYLDALNEGETNDLDAADEKKE